MDNSFVAVILSLMAVLGFGLFAVSLTGIIISVYRSFRPSQPDPANPPAGESRE